MSAKSKFVPKTNLAVNSIEFCQCTFVLVSLSKIFRKEKRQIVSLSFSSMQPFSPESIVETKRLNYGEISTQKCMALFRHNDNGSAARTILPPVQPGVLSNYSIKTRNIPADMSTEEPLGAISTTLLFDCFCVYHLFSRGVNIAHLLAGLHIPQARRTSGWYRRYDLFVKCFISGFTPDWLKIWILSRPFR
jgi:hypothetical protein